VGCEIEYNTNLHSTHGRMRIRGDVVCQFDIDELLTVVRTVLMLIGQLEDVATRGLPSRRLVNSLKL